VTGDGLAALATLPSLGSFSLARLAVSEAALAALTAGCAKNWNRIDLRDCNLTDAAVINLVGCESLTSVDIRYVIRCYYSTTN